jgi:hypothetical protein
MSELEVNNLLLDLARDMKRVMKHRMRSILKSFITKLTEAFEDRVAGLLADSKLNTDVSDSATPVGAGSDEFLSLGHW